MLELDILKFPFPQILKLIAKLGRVFEFHLFRSLAHLDLELVDGFLQLLR